MWLLKGILRKAKAAKLDVTTHGDDVLLGLCLGGLPSPLQAPSQPLQGPSPVSQFFWSTQFAGRALQGTVSMLPSQEDVKECSQVSGGINSLTTEWALRATAHFICHFLTFISLQFTG